MVKTVQQLRDAEKAFDLPTTHEEMESPSTCTVLLKNNLTENAFETRS